LILFLFVVAAGLATALTVKVPSHDVIALLVCWFGIVFGLGIAFCLIAWSSRLLTELLRGNKFRNANTKAFQEFLQPFRSSTRKVEVFCHGRFPQTDERFLANLDLPASPASPRIALAVRRAVANIGCVDSRFIRADDVFPDTLGVLPLWDSMDWLAYVMELEKELNTAIALDEMFQTVDPELASTSLDRISVRQLVTMACLTVNSRGANVG